MKTMKRILSLVLAVVMVFGIMTPAASAEETMEFKLIPVQYTTGKPPVANAVTTVNAGEKFYLQIYFSGNDITDSVNTADILFSFDKNLVTPTVKSSGVGAVVKSAVDPYWDVDGVIVTGNVVGNNEDIIFVNAVHTDAFIAPDDSGVLAEGILAEVEFTANADLDASALATFDILDTSVEVNGSSKVTCFMRTGEVVAATHEDLELLIYVDGTYAITGASTIAAPLKDQTATEKYKLFPDLAEGESVTWSVAAAADNENDGVAIAADDGTLTVYPSAEGDYAVTAIVSKEGAENKTYTKTITITKEARRIATIENGGTTTNLTIPVGNSIVTHTWNMEDQYGEQIFIADVTELCQINDDDRGEPGMAKDDEFAAMGITFDPTTNTLTVTSDAVKYVDADTGSTSTPYITFKTNGIWMTLKFELVRAASVPTTVEFAANAVDTVIIPADGAAAFKIACTGFIVKDQYGAEMADKTVVLALEDAYTNVSVSYNSDKSNYELTVDPEAEPGTVTLVATVSGTSVTAEKDVTLSYAGDILKSMEITVAETHDSTSAKNVPLTITGKNQYGNTMTPSNVTWSVAPEDGKVSVSGSTLTIAQGAYGIYTVTATSGSVTETKEITVNGLYTTGSIEDATVTYGDRYATAFAGKNGISVFYGDGVEDTALTGTWTISPETATAIGEQTVTFTFTSGKHTYTTTKDVNVAKKSVQVVLAFTEKTYNDNSAISYTVWVTDDQLIGTDTVADLALTFAPATAAGLNVGDYDVTCTYGDSNYNVNFLDGLGNKLRVKPAVVEIPTAKQATATYTGEAFTIVDVPANAEIVSGSNTVTNAGTHTVELALVSSNYIWSDNTTTNKSVSMIINPANAHDYEATFANRIQTFVLNKFTADDVKMPTVMIAGQPVEITNVKFGDDKVGFEDFKTRVAALNVVGLHVFKFEFYIADGQNYTGGYVGDVGIRIVNIDFAGEEDFVATEGTYGCSWASLFNATDDAALDAMIKATVGSDDEVAGTYTLYVDGTAFAELTGTPAKGEHTWEIKFTSDDDQFTGISVATGTVAVAAKSLADATVTGADKTYTGEALTTDVTVTLGGKTLVEGTDYTAAFSNNTNAGAATITVTGIGNYKETASGTFTIARASISDMTAVVDPAEDTYDGNEKEPDVTIEDLTKGTDFTVAYSNNINAGTATVTITGKGNYTGELTKTFKINPKTLEGTVVLSETEFTYDGKAKTPAATIEGLKEGTDFTVKYSDNKNVGTATVTVTGKGNYTGTLTKTFEIKKADAPETLTTEYEVEYKFSKTGEKVVSLMGIPADAGEVTYGELTVTDAKGIINTEAAADGKVTFNFTGLAAYEEGVTATITFDLVMGNYKTETITVTVKVLDKSVPNVQVANLVMDYTGVAADVSVLTKTSDVPGTWEWVVNPTNMPARAEAYTASVKFIPEDAVEYAEKTVNFTVTIKKATASVDSDVDMDEDNVVTPDRDDETLNDVLTAGDFSVDGTLVWTVTDEDGNVTHPTGDTKLEDIEGEITWTFTPDDTNNYTVINGSVEDDDYGWLIPGMGIAGVIIGSTSKNFKDVPTNAWYAKAVDFVVGRGLFNGVSDKEFNPDGSMTRAMLVTVLWRLEGEPVVGYGNNFRDVESGAWYYDAVTWASAEGIVNGYDAYTFGPNNLITREQMATILYRYAQMRNFNTDFHADLSKYADNGSISGYAREAMSWAVGTGIITGMTETTLNPAGTATRAQVATILMRFIRWYSL